VGKDREKSWAGIIDFPLPGRISKPREKGLTMVMDKGLGLETTKDLLKMAGEYIDFLKLGFGTSAFYSEKLLQKKIALAKEHQVDIYPGGTFLEVAVLQNKVDEYLFRAEELGFTAVEVSDGTIRLPLKRRVEIIRKALSKGFKVLTEVGKKDPREEIAREETLEQIRRDLEEGAWKVILEGRESGIGIGIYDSKGVIKKDAFQELAAGLAQPESIIWEAPLKSQQQELIISFGSNVNLGNIPTIDILALEALRVGLRGDTLKLTLEAE